MQTETPLPTAPNHLGPLKLLPCAPGVCQECAVDHDPRLPHNQQSLYWQYRFYNANGRWPTWDDAMAHCTPQTQALWRQAMAKVMGAQA